MLIILRIKLNFWTYSYTDYSLVWNMEHGNNEGDSTGTFIDWVNNISK